MPGDPEVSGIFRSGRSLDPPDRAIEGRLGRACEHGRLDCGARDPQHGERCGKPPAKTLLVRLDALGRPEMVVDRGRASERGGCGGGASAIGTPKRRLPARWSLRTGLRPRDNEDEPDTDEDALGVTRDPLEKHGKAARADYETWCVE